MMRVFKTREEKRLLRSYIRKTGRTTTDVCCGLVNYRGELVAGCGETGLHLEYSYQLDKNTRSLVSFCSDCGARLGLWRVM